MGEYMKKLLALMIVFFSVAASSAQQTMPAGFLRYLLNAPIIQNTSLFDLENNELYLAGDTIDRERSIFTRAVIYVNDQKGYRLFLTILGPYIFGSDGNILLDMSKVPGAEFWGWSIIARKNSVTKSEGLSIKWFANNGNRTTDVLPFIWDSPKDAFYLLEPEY
jgi:hypothetical protein